jgi:hypothetical protein
VIRINGDSRKLVHNASSGGIKAGSSGVEHSSTVQSTAEALATYVRRCPSQASIKHEAQLSACIGTNWCYGDWVKKEMLVPTVQDICNLVTAPCHKWALLSDEKNAVDTHRDSCPMLGEAATVTPMLNQAVYGNR